MWNLSFSLAKFRFKLRNEGSYLGIVWYLLNPLLFFLLLLFLFYNNIGGDIQYYPLYLLMGIIMFNFFASVTSESTGAILNNRGLIKSVKFPYESLILSNVLKSLFPHIFEIAIFVLLLIIFGINPIGIIFYPLIIFFFCLFIYGISLILSAFTVYIVDLYNVWDFIIRLLWFATPIFYKIGQGRLSIINLFNPAYYFITLGRDLIIYNRIPELWIIAGAVVYSLISFITGFIIFNKIKRKFAEMI